MEQAKSKNLCHSGFLPFTPSGGGMVPSEETATVSLLSLPLMGTAATERKSLDDYKIVAAEDEATSTVCQPLTLNGKPFILGLDEKGRLDRKYTELIQLAIQENGNAATLDTIFQWIKEKFVDVFRRHWQKRPIKEKGRPVDNPSDERCWKSVNNSLRHTLSSNKCFVKIPNSGESPKKGQKWRYDASQRCPLERKRKTQAETLYLTLPVSKVKLKGEGDVRHSHDDDDEEDCYKPPHSPSGYLTPLDKHPWDISGEGR
ncbi:hypothetical protein [Parendozoicomonas sp. Alg238-R29]|uniref:hypothetical protein n=1 Tax=Parendozoicomonas sp. Alg238-R29 TaxID=2993446 RepID=UPI00248E3F0D|nr:hypothetical protein [Parendozoicomonas sp. Alg238-R29]